MVLEISHVEWLDEAPVAIRPPLACRLRLRHRWIRVAADRQHSYVVCERCERLPARTIFESPVP